MRKYLLPIFLLFTFICSSQTIDFKNSIISLINSDEFKMGFRICDKKVDTINIYNNTSAKLETQYLKTKCGKILKVENSNLILDVNKPTKARDEKIVLYKFEKVKNKSVFRFLNTHSNVNLVIAISRRNKIEIIERGVF